MYITTVISWLAQYKLFRLYLQDLTLATTLPDWAKCELMWKMTALELKKKESYLR